MSTDHVIQKQMSTDHVADPVAADNGWAVILIRGANRFRCGTIVSVGELFSLQLSSIEDGL